MSKKMIAMLLAGGQGTRLKDLTYKIAKPAVSFGGKYRIIDFPLSNCTNSGIDTVGILSQYQPLVLNAYVGNGAPWDLDRNYGGVAVLPPHSTADGLRWYTGTASAIYENLNFIDSYNPEYVIILSADHIYKMNYNAMLDYHIEKNADVSISVIEVPWDEAPRFGIMNTDKEMNIVKFDEKPKVPKSNLASMGIYIFKTSVLKEYLTRDATNPDSTNDFGNDIIPMLLKEQKKLVAYPFKGYWKDVGTIDSLWEANMNILDATKDENDETLNLYEAGWKIYSKNISLPPQYIAENAVVENAMINEGCVVRGNVKNSLVFQGANINTDSNIKDSVIMNNAKIGKNVHISRAIIAPDAIVPDGTIIKSTDDEEIILYV